MELNMKRIGQARSCSNVHTHNCAFVRVLRTTPQTNIMTGFPNVMGRCVKQTIQLTFGGEPCFRSTAVSFNDNTLLAARNCETQFAMGSWQLGVRGLRLRMLAG